MTRHSSWSIAKSWPIEPPTGAGYDAAYIVRLSDETGFTHDLVVEFVAPSTLTSVGYAEEIARRFRDRAEPPAHVIVDIQRVVQVVGENRESSDVTAERGWTESH